jgi:APA family basic amino acid/polyamine antiporter
MKRPFRTPLVPLVPILGVVFCLYLMASLPLVTWIRFVVWLAVGMVIYFSYGRFHSRVQNNVIDKAAASGR